MPTSLHTLCRSADNLLQPEKFNDYCPNGLQVEGRPDIAHLVTGVTACRALLEAALEVGADAILVHHGYFWRGEDARVVGMKRRRLGLLLEHDISLLAYHLPLDAHPKLGNNVQLARRLDISVEGALEPDNPHSIGNVGRLSGPLSPEDFAGHIEAALGRRPLLEVGNDRPIERVAWCTGAAQGYIEQAAALGVDAFLTGEVSEQSIHQARELGVTFIAAGHHATERYGAPAVGEHLAKELGLSHTFIDIDNPV